MNIAGEIDPAMVLYTASDATVLENLDGRIDSEGLHTMMAEI